MEERHKRLLVRQNPWWQDRMPEMPGFERDMLGELMKHLEYKQTIALVGLRRTGKTVLLKQIIARLDAPKNNICYISFDDIDFQRYETAEELIGYFLEFSDSKRMRYIFLDEIQKLGNWPDLLKVLYDTEENLKIFISGSSSLELKKSRETLAGRLLSFHLPVLSFSEFARYFNLQHEASKSEVLRDYDLRFAAVKEKYSSLFDAYLERGAFPELLEIEDEEFIKKYIRESVIEKSVTDIARAAGSDEKTIYELLRLLAASNSQLFEVVNLANTLKINRNLASKYIELLEKSFLLRVSYNYTGSVVKQVRSSKKQYCAHSSIVLALLEYPFSALKTEISGHLVEAVIANSIEKMAFWRNAQKDEVDIIDKSSMLPIEVKYKSQITGNDLKPLAKFCNEHKIREAFVVTKDMAEERRHGNISITFIPAWLFLLLKRPR